MVSILTQLQDKTLLKDLTESDVVDKAITAYPMTIKVIFKGQGEPSLEVSLTMEVLRMMTIAGPGDQSILGQSIINGYIFHFDKGNKKLGIEKIGSDGCDKPYFKTTKDDDSAAVSVFMTSSALSVVIMAAVVAAIF